MSTFRTITSNTLYQAGGKALAILISLITTGLLTRHLGQAGYGQYTLITTIILLFGTLTDWGTGFIATRMASRKDFPEPQIYGNLLILRVLASTIGAIIMITLGIFQIVDLPLPLFFLGSLIIFALALRNTMQVIFQTHLKLQYGAIVEAATSLIFLAITAWAITQTFITPASVVLYLLISSTLAGFLALYFGIKLSPISYTLNPKIISYLVRESAPMGALLVVFSIYNRLDSFILQYYQGDTAVGLYGLAYKIHDNLVVGAAFFMNAMYPLIAKSSSSPFEGEARACPRPDRGRGHLNQSTNSSIKPITNYQIPITKTQKLFSTSFHLLLIAGLLISTIFFIFAKPVILLLAGPDYLIAVDLLRILMVATFIAYINHLTGYTLAAIGLQKISLLIALIALSVNLALNYLFIPIYSFYASAWITIVTEAIVLSLSLTYLTQRQNLAPRLLTLPDTLKNLLINRTNLF